MGDKLKEGISVKELETFARKHLNEGLLILAIVIASFSSMLGFFTGPIWSIAFAGLCAVLGIAFPDQVMKLQKPIFKFLSRQDKTTQITIGIVRVILAIFIPFVIFAEMGFLAGSSFHHMPRCMLKVEKKIEEKTEEI